LVKLIYLFNFTIPSPKFGLSAGIALTGIIIWKKEKIKFENSKNNI